MEMIIKEVDRLENIIRQLIKLTAVGVSRPVPSDINHIINNTVRSFEEELKNKKIELKLELMDRPPAVSLDGNRIMTAISNLVKNAIEAIETPGKQIKISTRVSDEHMEIEVSDNGKGIPKEKIKYIFDPLFTSKVYAPGLGLTFVKSIIYEHRGTISVQSGPGKGTTFTIRLPL